MRKRKCISYGIVLFNSSEFARVRSATRNIFAARCILNGADLWKPRNLIGDTIFWRCIGPNVIFLKSKNNYATPALRDILE